MEVKRIMLSPEQATELLGLNTANRPLNGRRVQTLADAILRGEWVEDGNPIRVSASNELLDGQHRLAAVIKAAVPVPAVLATGLPDEARLAIDSGMKRTFGHYLAIMGTPQSSAVAATTRLVWLYSQGHKSLHTSGFTPTNAELLACFQKYESEIQSAIRISGRIGTHIRGAQSVVGLAVVAFSEIDGEDADFFFGDLASGAPERNQTALLARTLNDPTNERWIKTGGQNAQARLFAYYIKAWNAFRDGRDLVLLRYKSGGAQKESFPIPI